MSWTTIESDPGVFTELIEQFGVQNVQVEELYSLEPAEFERVGPTHGLIFLFKWIEERDDRPTIDATDVPDLFFANQVITNACATQAILSVLLNAADIDVGQTLADFKAFSQGLPADCRGLAISNSEKIREAHNSFARNDPFIMDEVKATKEDDVYHFIAFVPFNGTVYELDGLKAGPVVLGHGEDWLTIVRPAIEERMARYSQGEIRFNLMAIVGSRLQICEQELGITRSRVLAISQALEHGDGLGATLEDGFRLGGTAAELQAQSQRAEQKIEHLQAELREERKKREAYKRENVRRRHNYIPFVVTLLKQLARHGHLQGLIDKGTRQQQLAAEAAKSRP